MNKTQKTSLLLLLLNFEKYWIPFFISDGHLFESDAKREAKALIDYYESLLPNSSDGVGKPKKRLRIEKRERGVLQEFINSLSKWLSSDKLFPDQSEKVFVTSSKNYILAALSELETDLCQDLSLPICFYQNRNEFDGGLHEKMLRWSGQFPDEVVPKVNEQFIKYMSESDSIILVADIRRSQDLMTYGLDPEQYRSKIIEFIDEVRRILKDHYAIYDRFTGDGFIAYFNEYMCEQEGKDYYQMMLQACEKIITFSKSFFPCWRKQLRKIPNEEIGVSIGVDSGRVSYKDIKNQLFAIGDACVWATRMSAAGKAGEIIFNNLPFQRLIDSGSIPTNQQNSLSDRTKNGEDFLAYKIDFNCIKYEPKREDLPLGEKPGVIN